MISQIELVCSSEGTTIRLKVTEAPVEGAERMDGGTGIGARLRTLRRDADLTQEQLAEAAGVSVDLIGKLERGDRPSARLSSLLKLATALDVDLSALAGKRPRLDHGEDASILAVRDTVLAPGVLPGITDEDSDAPRLTDLERTVRGAWLDYWGGRLSRLTTIVPGLLGEARMASHEYGPGAARSLAQAYQLAACLLVHLGKDDLAVMAAERAVNASMNGDDRLLWATMNGTWAWCVHHQGRLDAAERHALRVAEEIEPDFTRSPLPHLTVWGGLILTGLASAAAAERVNEVREYIGLARTGTGRFEGDRHDYEVSYGPSQVQTQACHAWTMLRKPDEALKAAKGVHRADLYGISYGRHLLDKASAHTDARHFQTAESVLAEAQGISAEWFRHQGPARALVGELVRESRRLTPGLRRLARMVDVER
ncbi:helix-turn-helix transcriptional regulator [Actinomadura sp. 6K520]|uniref:helix-turn-helix domain-containing protein n=1 Tax=Actinomadura sp. 6K520 TaxID=2530364 RepID=UPI001A9DFB26|nr:helix-turn-helix transcriptional regulator [Actinomadura sp. 6K520]